LTKNNIHKANYFFITACQTRRLEKITILLQTFLSNLLWILKKI